MMPTIGEMQFVVHDAFETISWLKYLSLFTPSKKVCSTPPLVGADTTTFFAPASICALAESFSVNLPVHSKTTSTFSSFQGSFAGSFSLVT